MKLPKIREASVQFFERGTDVGCAFGRALFLERVKVKEYVDA